MNYQKAVDVQKLLADPAQRILSKRGSAVVDVRTNTLFVQDVPSRLEEVRRLISKIDVAVRQVMIEARIVEANDSFAKNLGARLGIMELGPSGRRIGGNPGFNVGAEVVNPSQALGVTQGNPPTNGPGLNSDFPAAGLNSFQRGQFSFVLFNSSLSRLINVELSALEADGRGKIIASPRVLTADQAEAIIEQGTEIPYQQATSSGA